jgi:hypothetical protein
MQPIQISLVPLGNLKYPVSIAELKAWKSQVINIRHDTSVGHLPNSDSPNWVYSDAYLLQVLSANSNSNFTLGVINAPLQENYYLRRLSDRAAILSLYEMADIVRLSDFRVEQYILRNAYVIAVLLAENGRLSPDYVNWAHDETRGCLFDMNATKSDIVFSLDRPVLCQACRTRLSGMQVPANLLPNLDRELQRIQKTLYVQITEWIKFHPICALAITAISGTTLNLIASVIFEKAKKMLPWLS